MINDAETETTYCAQAWSAFRFNLENNTGCPWLASHMLACIAALVSGYSSPSSPGFT